MILFIFTSSSKYNKTKTYLGILKHHTADSLARISLETEFCLLDLDSMDFGSIFIEQLQKANLSTEAKVQLKDRAMSFLLDLFIGFQKRFEGSFSMLRKIKNFSPSIFKDVKVTSQLFPQPFFPQDIKSLVEFEYISKKIQSMDLQEACSVCFWISLHLHQDFFGTYIFRPLTTHVLKILCLPISNAEVERVFTLVKILKRLLSDKVNNLTLMHLFLHFLSVYMIGSKV